MQLLRHTANRAIVNCRSANVRSASADEKAMTIEAVLSTEQAVRMFDYRRWEPFDEILLASGRVESSHIPLLDSHCTETINRVLGHLEEIRTESSGDVSDTVGKLMFDQDDEAAVRAFRKYRGGHARDVSVGYEVLSHTIVEPGESVTIGERTFTAGPKIRLRVASKWRLDELSLVPRGADSGAKTRSDGVASIQISLDELDTLLAKRSNETSAGMVPEDDTTTGPAASGTEPGMELQGDNQRSAAMSGTKLTDAVTGGNTETETRANQDELLRRGAEFEAKRRKDIRAIAEGITESVVTACLDDITITVDQARAKFLEDIQTQRKTPVIGADAPNVIPSGNRRERDVNTQSLACALASRLGADMEKVGHRILLDPITGEMRFEKPGYKGREEVRKELERNMERADKFRDIHSVDLCREALQIAQVEVPMGRRELVTRAFSTPTVSTIYSTASGALLVSQLGDMLDSTQGWTAEVEAKSFKPQELHRIEGGGLKRRARGKEADHANFADTMEVYRVYDFARQLIIDRQDAIDDELGAWRTAMDHFALAILSLRPDVVYALLLSNPTLATDNVALFHAATHLNLYPSATPLNAANLQTALSALASQKGEGGLNLNLRDAAVIVPEPYSFTADQLANSAEVREAAAANGTNNPLKRRGLLVQSDSRINTGFTDPVTDTAVAAAATTWFVAAKNGRYGVHVGTLQGTNGMPTLSSTVLNSQGKYGIAIDVQHTIGAGVAGFQGLVKAVG